MKALLEKRDAVFARIKELRDLANQDGRPWTKEDDANFAAANEEYDSLSRRIAVEERAAALSTAQTGTTATAPETRSRPGQEGNPGQQRAAHYTPTMERVFGRYDSLSPEFRALVDRDTAERHAAFRASLRGESRAYTVQNPAEGGFTVTPMQFQAGIVATVLEISPIVGQCLTIPVTAGNLGVITETAEPADAEWTSELLTGTEETTQRVGLRSLAPRPLVKFVKLSNQLRRMSANFEQFVIQRLSAKMAAAKEKAILRGSGTNEPLGVFTASTSGVTTARDVNLGSTTDITDADKLIDMLYTLKATHQRNATWVMHRDAAKKVRKLKTGAGDYVWQPGFAAAPDTILGRPLVLSEYAPNTFTSALYTIALGDFGYYTIGDWMTMQLQIAEERYIETNQTGFFLRGEYDGQPTLAEAFVRGKQSV